MASSIYGRVGGVIDGLSIQCATGPDFIRGRIGGDIFGADIDLHVDTPGGTVTGRIGGAIIGKSVAISISRDLPPILSALVAVLTYYYYLVNTRNRGSGGSSGRGG
ncbi:MAG: hypothetical protein PHH46_09555 [Firmicutes bacterium]|jgi:hypothetical protein|nr:hypothetical protein [Bacillota bacterium]